MEAEALKRIRTVTHCLPKEVEQIQNGIAKLKLYSFDFYVEQKDEDPKSFVLSGYIQGPLGSPWEGFLLSLLIDLKGYPTSVPKIYFVYPIHHPNYKSDKQMCTGNLGETWNKGDQYNSTLCYRNIQ